MNGFSALTLQQIEQTLAACMPDVSTNCQVDLEGSLTIQMHYRQHQLTVVGVRTRDLKDLPAVEELGRTLRQDIRTLFPSHSPEWSAS